MKTQIKKLFLMLALLVLGSAPRLNAQTFTSLHSFTNSTDGANPEAGLILSGNTLYGTATQGGTYGSGTVFAINTDGTSFTTLHSFTATNSTGTNSDGVFPAAGLVLSGNTLYGTAETGGSSGNGTVFAVSTNGNNFTNLYSFTTTLGNVGVLGFGTNSDGAVPHGLILSGNILYGTSEAGGSSGNGTVFALNTDGTGFTNLHSFTTIVSRTNNDGAIPFAGLILSGNTLYGTAQVGGSLGGGTVFALETDGTYFTNLHSFTAIPVSPPFTNSDGGVPEARLILSGNTLYGTASQFGSLGNGTIFSLNTNGISFTNLYNFTNGNDGAFPVGGLVLSGDTLYGTAETGGNSGDGTVFAINTDGSHFTTLYSFTNGSDGAFPFAGELILSDNILYGTTLVGGSFGNGTVFSILLTAVVLPPLYLSGTMLPANGGFQLSFTNTPGLSFSVLSTTNLALPLANWSVLGSAQEISSGQYQFTDTQTINLAGKFYRVQTQ